MAHWSQVIFAEESRYNFYPVDGQMGVRWRPGEQFMEECLGIRLQDGGSCVMSGKHSMVVQNLPLCPS